MELTIKLLCTSILYTTASCHSASLQVAGQANQTIVEQQLPTVCEDQFSNLIKAIRETNLRLVIGLLDEGTDVNATDREGLTPLCYGLKSPKPSLKIIRELIAKSDLTYTDPNRDTYLHIAISSENYQAAAILLDNGSIDVNAKNNNGDTPLGLVLQDPDTPLGIMETLIAKSDLTHTDSDGFTYLACAAYFASYNALNILLDNGSIDVNKQNKSGYTALGLALENPNLPLEMIKKLIDASDLQFTDPEGKTYLHLAAYFSSPEAVKMLLEKGSIDVNTKDKSGYTALGLALANPNLPLEIIKKLIDASDLQFTDPTQGWTCLHLAAYFSSYETVKMLLEKGSIDVNTKNKSGYTALGLALENPNPHLEMIKKLIDASDLQFTDPEGKTYLHLAAYFSSPEALKMLLEKGNIDVNTQDKSGYTALDVALMGHNTDVIQIFAKHIATQSKSKFEDTLQPLSELIIIGKDIKEYTIMNWKNHVQSTGGIVIDFNEKETKTTDILQFINNSGKKVDENTRIILNAHGHRRISNSQNSHHIKLVCVMPTRSFFSYLKGLFQVPLCVQLFSCHGGAANQDIDALETGSLLCTYCRPESLLHRLGYEFAYKALCPNKYQANPSAPYEAIINNWIYSAVNHITLNRVLGPGQVVHHVFMDPTQFVSDVVEKAQSNDYKPLTDQALTELVRNFFRQSCEELAEVFPDYKENIMHAMHRAPIEERITEAVARQYISGVVTYLSQNNQSDCYALKFDCFIKAIRNNEDLDLNQNLINPRIPVYRSIHTHNPQNLKTILPYEIDLSSIHFNTQRPLFPNGSKHNKSDAIISILLEQSLSLVSKGAANKRLNLMSNDCFFYLLGRQIFNIHCQKTGGAMNMNDFIRNDMVRYNIDSTIQQLSEYERYIILLDKRLPKQLYSIVKKHGSIEEMKQCIMTCIKLDPKKKVIESITDVRMKPNKNNKKKKCFYLGCVMIPKRNRHKENIKLIQLLLSTLEYDVLLANKEVIKNKIRPLYSKNQRKKDRIALTTYVMGLHRHRAHVTQDDQQIHQTGGLSTNKWQSCDHIQALPY